MRIENWFQKLGHCYKTIKGYHKISISYRRDSNITFIHQNSKLYEYRCKYRYIYICICWKIAMVWCCWQMRIVSLVKRWSIKTSIAQNIVTEYIYIYIIYDNIIINLSTKLCDFGGFFTVFRFLQTKHFLKQSNILFGLNNAVIQ